MGEIKIPPDVCLVVSILYVEEEMLNLAAEELKNAFGDGRLLGFVGRFDYSDYYNEELGTPIMRRFWKADRLIRRDLLADVKIKTNQIESKYSDKGKRRFNLDPGFLSLENFVLATTKNYTHRIYLKDGIYADLTLIYKEKDFRPLEWTYPDYRGEEIRQLLKSLREEYLQSLRRA